MLYLTKIIRRDSPMPVDAGTYEHRDIITPAFVIPNAGEVSQEVDLGGGRLVAFQWPAAFTGTATLEGRFAANGTWGTLQDTAGNALTFTFAANEIRPLDANITAGARFVRLRASTTQGAERVIPTKTLAF